MNTSRGRRCVQLHPARSRAGRGFASAVAIVLLIAAAPSCLARDAFDAVRCDGDVKTALVGKKVGDERVALLEKKHADIGLRNEGGEEVSDSVFYQSWTICTASYHLLERDGVVRDVLRADHSRRSPAFLGTCKLDGAATPYRVFAILEAGAPDDAKGGPTSPADARSLHASAAWRIEEASAQFIHMDATGLMCPADGISTVDGGP